MGLGLKKNDQVIVISGKSKGKKGKLVRFSPDRSRAYVEGVNLIKRFLRKSRQNPQGGLIEQEASIHLSNLALFDAKAKKGVRFKNQILEDGSKRRVSAKTGEDISQD